MQLGYIEERNVGVNFHEHYAVFSPSNSFVAIISNQYVIIFDTESGKRTAVLFCEKPVVGLKWTSPTEVIALTDNCEFIWWEVQSSFVQKRSAISYSGVLKYAYNVGETFFAVAHSKGTNDTLIRLDIDNNTIKHCASLPCVVSDRRKIAPASNYAVLVDKLVVRYMPYGGRAEGQFTINSPFAENRMELSSVAVVRDNVFAVLNCGRIYCWTDVESRGVKTENHFFFHAHNNDVRVAVTSLLTLICGTNNCNVDKWNLMSTGRGRYEKRQTVERMDAPIENVFLSPDDSFLLVVMADNSLVILNSSSLAVVSRPQVLLWPVHSKPSEWLSLYTDNENPDYIVTNARFGCVQWIDPVKWRTVSEVDICKENSPSADGPSQPLYNWCNIYRIALSTNLMITVECRRFDDQKSYVRFFKRITNGSINDMKEMDCIPITARLKFVRLSLEDISNSNVSDELSSKEYAVVVNFSGNIAVYRRSVNDSEKWSKDLLRSMEWQQTKIRDCSTIRQNFMAAVHEGNQDEASTVVVIWNTHEFTISAFLDEMPNVSEVRWCPRKLDQEFLLLIASKNQLTMYDSSKQCYVWTIFEPDLHIYTNPFCTVAHRRSHAFILANDGSIDERVKFSGEELQVVATGSSTNVRLSGLSTHGLALLKLENEENTMSMDIRSHKFTPFTVLVQNSKQQSKTKRREYLDIKRATSARKILQGSIQTLVPISKLAPGYIHSCLLKKTVQ